LKGPYVCLFKTLADINVWPNYDKLPPGTEALAFLDVAELARLGYSLYLNDATRTHFFYLQPREKLRLTTDILRHKLFSPHIPIFNDDNNIRHPIKKCEVLERSTRAGATHRVTLFNRRHHYVTRECLNDAAIKLADSVKFFIPPDDLLADTTTLELLRPHHSE
jgi:hypothetical protein